MADPDFIYDPEDWEVTYEWSMRSDAAQDVLSRRLGEIKRFCTLISGPDKFAAYVLRPNADDEDDVELRWFDTEAAARAACAMPAYITDG